ncbi:MAG: assimilatory sulfite reductase (NADPH) flavoprotein subunit [Coraliomargaritaceae bacterium]
MAKDSFKFPENAPFEATIKKALESTLSQLESSELSWLTAYLQNSHSSSSKSASELLILYGTESGNAENLAQETQNKANQLGIRSKISNMADISVDALSQTENLVVIVSTWGEGDPPETATAFYDAFMGDSAPSLKKTRFSVLALGDTSYEHFCKIGKDFDTRLESLGANRLYERKDCDVDFDDDFAEWSDGALNAFAKIFQETETLTATAPQAKAVESIQYNRKNPYPSKLSERINLNGTGSSKQTMHLEFDLTDSGLHYEAGDSLAVQPKNSDALVESLLQAGSFKADSEVSIKGETASLGDAFKNKLDITTLSIPFLNRYNELAQDARLQTLLDQEDKKEIQNYISGRDLIDLLSDFPLKGKDPQALVSLLRKLPPRLYSIASSQKADPNSVHLTVATVRYHAHKRDREGVCSTYLADRLTMDSTADVFVTANKNFKLPKDNSTPIIMVGPGTGIAPFRAFMQERKATGAQGKNWLFFGDQHFLTDFLYQTEWQNYQKEGLLNKIDLAFSRDQAEKVYVQHKMQQNAKELYEWIDSGAYFYVCGDASRMAHDVDEALHSIIEEQAGISKDASAEYVQQMKSDKRYLRDVY